MNQLEMFPPAAATVYVGNTLCGGINILSNRSAEVECHEDTWGHQVTVYRPHDKDLQNVPDKEFKICEIKVFESKNFRSVP